ncbi:hypothetical protein TNCT_388311 [Trichonephila clavata]|uniref:Uncharacterized protein n=1 Tax=Trichonephila clavata TaxID=2740835 RepID=A0A8X6F3P3_TRICU|nr:hypothetical protein TNCT_388311 [Trichonephila clavata]
MLVVVEAAMSNSPLVYEGEIGGTEGVLTSGYFLTGQKFTKIPLSSEPSERRENPQCGQRNIYYNCSPSTK